MSFAIKVKKEILNKINKTNASGFIDGIVYASLVEKDLLVSISIRNRDFLEELLFIFDQANYQYKINKNTIIFSDRNINFINKNNATYFLAGVFFICGSISKLDSSSYHLQMSLKNKQNMINLINFVKKHLNFKHTSNKKYYIMYIKKQELIADFLYIIGAQKSYFEFLDNVIKRDHRNQMTRISNLDIHNQTKLVDSHQLFLSCFNLIKEKNLEYKFTKEQLLFFNLRKNNPYLPLSQLVDEFRKKYNITKTKGGLNHWLIKLRKVCNEFI